MSTYFEPAFDPEFALVVHDLNKGDRGGALKRSKKMVKRNPEAALEALARVKSAALDRGDTRSAQKAADGQRDALNRIKKNRR